MRDLGKVGLRDTGVYDPTFEYEILDICKYNDTIYCCHKENTPVGTLPTDTNYFNEWVSGSTVPIATTQTAGIVKPDGTTVTVDSDGTIHGASTYELPVATQSTLGGIKPDGTTTTVDANGVLSALTTGTAELIELTQAEYDALTPAEKADDTKAYFIKDTNAMGIVDASLDSSSHNPIQNAPVATSINALNSGLSQIFDDYLKIKVNTASVSALNVGFNDIYITPAPADVGYHHIGMLTVFPQTGQNISLVGIAQGTPCTVRLYNHSNAQTSSFVMHYAMLEAKDNIFNVT